MSDMSDQYRDQGRDAQLHGREAMQHGQQAQHHAIEGIKNLLPTNGPSASKVVATATLLPLGGTLLVLSGLTLAATLTGLAIATPIFLLFSPVLVPAAIALGLAVTGFLTSGALGLTGVTSLSYILRYVKGASERVVPETLEQAKRRMGEAVQYAGQAAQYTGQKTKEVGQQIQQARVPGVEATRGHESR